MCADSLQELAKDFVEKQKQHKTKLKFFLYSDHDPNDRFINNKSTLALYQEFYRIMKLAQL
jgi:hypothetical protein